MKALCNEIGNRRGEVKKESVIIIMKYTIITCMLIPGSLRLRSISSKDGAC